MDQEREFQGKSLEEALEHAAADLGRPSEELKYEILEDGRKGFLGIGGRPVRIRILEAAAPVPESAGLRSAPRGGTVEGPRGFDRSRQGRKAPPRRGGETRGGEPRGRAGNETDGNRAPRGSGQPAARAGSGSHGRENVPGRARTGDPNRAIDPNRRSIPDQASDAPYSLHEAVRTVAGRILKEMGLELKARLRDRDEAVILELSGADAKLLLADEGEALDSLQHILNRILSRDERFGSRVVVDCEGFRGQRDEETIERAKRGAEEALRTGQPVYIDGLNAYERRLTHIALAEDKEIKTYSIGDGAIKRLTIEPVSRTAGTDEG